MDVGLGYARHARAFIAQPFTNPTPAQKTLACLFIANVPTYLAWRYHARTCLGCWDGFVGNTCALGSVLYRNTLFDPSFYPINQLWTWITSCFTHQQNDHFWATAVLGYGFYIYVGPLVPTIGPRSIGVVTVLSASLGNFLVNAYQSAMGVRTYGCGSSGILRGFFHAYLTSAQLRRDRHWGLRALLGIVQVALPILDFILERSSALTLAREDSGSPAHMGGIVVGALYGLWSQWGEQAWQLCLRAAG